jgi:pimeloyl-ACP methyl ester carboxylesterase
MATYVLIHDGFSGGWSWDRVAPLLRDAGHGVYAPSLIGLGERAHLATPEIGLRAQVAGIAEMIEREDLHDVILVGHSYGGMVITGVAGEVPGRIAHLVYADAMVPRDGEAAANLIPRLITRLRKQAKAAGGWRVPSRPEGGLRLLRAVMKQLSGRRNLIETRFARQVAAPLKQFEESLQMSDPAGAAALPRTYIHFTGGGLATPVVWLLRRVYEPRLAPPPMGEGWRYRKLPTIHAAMDTMPREFTDLLLEVAVAQPQV